MSLNLLILAAGYMPSGNNEVENYPICLTEINGQSLLEIIIRKTSPLSISNHIVALREADCRQYFLDKVAELLIPSPHVVKIPENTAGAACSALLALCRFNYEDSVLVVSANEMVDVDLKEIVSLFEAKKLDAGTITFNSIHPRYSYVRIDPKSNLIVEAAQNVPLSKHATVGIFWFRKLQDFVAGAEEMIRKDAAVDGKYYIAPIFNQMILRNKKIGYFNIDNNKYVPLKNKEQISRLTSKS